MSAVVETTEKILSAAASLIAERGYAGTTTRAIAELAGVNEVTIFRRFHNKAGVLQALGQRFGEMQAGNAVDQTADPDDTQSTLLALARMEITGAAEWGGAAMRLAFDARSVPEVAEVIGDGPRRNMEGLAAYMAMRQTAGDLRADLPANVLAEAFFALTSTYVMYRTILGAADMPDAAEIDKTLAQLFDLFWSGAAAKEGATS